MYLLVGNSHMEHNNYEGAIQSFERARASLRHHTSRLVSVVSLVSFLTAIIATYRASHLLRQISGWTFNDLCITIRQRLCEALFAAGRTTEGGESLLNMVNTFDKEFYMPITEWVSGEFMAHQFGCPAFETSPQILPADASPPPRPTVMQPRRLSDMIKRQHFLQPAIRRSSCHS